MDNRDHLGNIIDRILNGSQTEEDIAQLRRSLKIVDGMLQVVSQDGKFNTNIGQITGGDIHIGDRIYQGAGSQTIREIIRSLLQELQSPVPQRQYQHHYPQSLLEENILAEYYKKAGELISESYVRNCKPVIDDRCNDNLKRLQSSLQLLPEKTKDINEEVLKLCESYGEPFKEQIQELKLILRNHGACSIQVREWLEDCPKFIRDQQFVGTACSLVGYQLYVEGTIETTSDFIKELIKSYPDSPLAYVTQGLIYYKQGKLKQSLEIIRSARHFYEKQENRVEEIRHFEEMEQVIQQLIQQSKFWNRFRHNVTYTVAVITKFFILG